MTIGSNSWIAGDATSARWTRSDQPFDTETVNPLDRLLLLLFCTNIALIICLVKWQVASVPVRALFALACLGLIMVYRWEVFVRALANHRIKFTIIGLVAIFGVVSSALANESPTTILRQILEIHVQAFVALALGASMVAIWGVRPVMMVLVGCVLVSAAIGVLQFLGFSPAWELRAVLGGFQGDPPTTTRWYTKDFRALGLSFSPVILATQASLAFIAYWACRLHQTRGRSMYRVDYAVLVALFLFVFVSLSSGNRSPILGAVIFFAAYAASRDHKFLLLTVSAALICAPFVIHVLGVLGETELRVARTGDGSSLGRFTLAQYGLQLFLDRPIGYGLGFDPRELWPAYWKDLQHMANPEAIQKHALHNYYLNALNEYGLPIVFVGIFTLYKFAKDWRVLLPFLIYMVHIYFHNEGPLQADILIWYVLPLLPLGHVTSNLASGAPDAHVDGLQGNRLRW